jgi:hypothetical protein
VKPQCELNREESNKKNLEETAREGWEKQDEKEYDSMVESMN